MSAAKRCSRCGARLLASKPRVYSRFTGSYYCVDDKACARRAKRSRRAAEAVTA